MTLWIEFAMGFGVFVFFLFNLTGLKILNRRKKEWREIYGDAMLLKALFDHEYLKLEKLRGISQRAINSEQPGVSALINVTALANQVPTTFSVEYIKKHLWSEFDPERMRAAFLSFTQYDSGPQNAKNALMTVLYGLRKQQKDRPDEFFIRVYSNDGTFIGENAQSVLFAGKAGEDTHMALLQHAFGFITQPPSPAV